VSALAHRASPRPGLRRRRLPFFVLFQVLVLLAGSGCDQPPAQKGLYYWGHEVNVVCPCGSSDCYWVRGEKLLLGTLRSYVQKQISQPYQPVYLEYRGRMLDEPRIGYAVNYEGYLEITEVLSLSVALPEHCPSP
jgi:hypothetical protein